MLNLLCFLTVAVCFLCYVVGWLNAKAKYQTMRADVALEEKNYWRELFQTEALKTLLEANRERKLWVNKALVRAGGTPIFDEGYITGETDAQKSDKPGEMTAPEEILTPFAEKRKQWREEDQKQRDSVGTLPPDQAEIITNSLQLIKKESQ